MVSLHTKPLFHEKTLSKVLGNIPDPPDFEEKLSIVRRWVKPLKSGTLDVVKEVSLHGEFLRDVFGNILGYKSVVTGEGKEWSLHAETHISDGGGSADGALGFFSAVESKKGISSLQGRIVAPIELKGASNDLDRPAPGRKESAVEQGWRYANYTEGCRWVIVSNYREIRLYRTNKTPAFYERFLLEELTDPKKLKRFYFLLSVWNFLPPQKKQDADSRIDLILKQSDNAEEEITKSLYTEYKNTRLKLVQWLEDNGPKDIAPNVLIEKVQKILDRVLFIAFCEDRGLLPADTIKKAHDHRDPYSSASIWTRYKAVFHWVDQGNDDPPIPGYNGGLYKHDPILDEQIELPDKLCTELNAITRYDYDTDVSVEVLGHIFEQSVTDLEELKAIATGQEYEKKKGKRKTQGVYYTPALITQYIVELALGGYLQQKEEELRIKFKLESIPQAHSRKLKAAERKFWEAYRDVLKNTRVLDPACGSGAFLIAAFDYLLAQYERVNNALASIEKGQHSIFDLNKTILNNNLYGVDLSKESVEITKLSLWLKTAQRGKQLTFLDDNIQQGDSIVAEKKVSPNAFDWQERFSQVFADGGFDVVIGNPPYVRQELLSPIKPYLETNYHSYDGVADLYTYFYERGVQNLKPQGILSFIVTNKWLKAGYGEALRKYFSEHTIFEQILDFGHAPIFADADVFPCIVSIRKPDEEKSKKPESPVIICPIPREKLPDINLKQYVQQHGYQAPWKRYTEKAWSLEHPAVDDLMEKIRSVGIPLSQTVDSKPRYGIKTGYMDAFVIDSITRKAILSKDPQSEEIIRPCIRGQDLKRWHPSWANLYMIAAHNGLNIERYPGVKGHLETHKARLEKRAGKQEWWQWQASPNYFRQMDGPKIMYQDLSFHPRFCYVQEPMYAETTCFFLPTEDHWILSVLNSPLAWAYLWRNTVHGKDEVLRLKSIYMEHFPITQPDKHTLPEVKEIVSNLIELTKHNQHFQSNLKDWLTIEILVEKPGNKLSDAASLDSDTFIAEIKKRRPRYAGKLGVGDLKRVRDAYEEIVPDMQKRRAEILRHERRLSDLVNEAYGLTPEEIDLMWKTAPPRMPVGRS
ncbi:MAG: Eco57I restriction-modification methylase domain-containing protein [Myxococcota bacterium]|nr:Eco57I restriction-modification methylase domain-containing protein [Myxococcota bacterium]